MTNLTSPKNSIFAASLSNLFELYDFFIYALLAGTMAKVFFSDVSPSTAYIWTLIVFALGFIVRPFGGLLFGSIGDRVGRKSAFILTTIMMGLSTMCIGFVPSCAEIGVWAPIILVVLRSLQGFALGGEFAGSTIYVSEQAPSKHRSTVLSIAMLMGQLGIILVSLVIFGSKAVAGSAFEAWGWRLPFFFSGLLCVVTLILRLYMSETPVFDKLIQEEHVSKTPLKELFAGTEHGKTMLVTIFGLVAAPTTTFFMAFIFPSIWLINVAKLDEGTVSELVLIATMLSMPFTVLFGWLADKVGRKPIVYGACILSAMTYFPIYHAILEAANPLLVEHPTVDAVAQERLLFLLFILTLGSTMALGAGMTMISEIFSSKIRYSAMGFSYNVGVILFSGLMPSIIATISAMAGNVYSGLWYPVVVLIVTTIIGVFFAPERKGHDIS
jgi:MFS family permease